MTQLAGLRKSLSDIVQGLASVTGFQDEPFLVLHLTGILKNYVPKMTGHHHSLIIAISHPSLPVLVREHMRNIALDYVIRASTSTHRT